MVTTSDVLRTAITWSSSDTDYVTDAGVVTRPAAGESNELVTLTATLTIGSETRTKEFEFIVVAELLVMTINELKTAAQLDTPTVVKGDNILIKGKVIALFEEGDYKGFYVYDGTGFMYAHVGTDASGLEVGDVVLLDGEFDVYFGMPQIAYPTVTELDETIADPTATVKTIADILAYSDTDGYDMHNYSQLITVEGKITKDSDYYYLEAANGDKIELNDDSDIALYMDALGREGTFTVVYHSYHSSHENHQVSSTGIASDFVLDVLTPQQALDADIANAIDAQPMLTLDDLTLPDTGKNGTVFTAWASDTTAVLDNDGSFVALGAMTTTVTFTATATFTPETGTAVTDTVTFEVQVPVATNACDVLELDEDDALVVTGVVYYEVSYGFFIYADGCYVNINDSSYNDQVKFGDEVTVVGYVGGFYHKMMNIAPVSVTVNSSGNTPMAPSYEVAAVGDLVNMLEPYGSLRTITGEIIEVADGSYTDTYIQDSEGNMIQVHYKSNVSALEDFVGDIVTINVLVYGFDYVWFAGTADHVHVQTAFTDEQIAEAVWAEVLQSLGNIAGVASDLPLEDEFVVVEDDETTTEVDEEVVAELDWATSDAGVVTHWGSVTLVSGTEGMATLTVDIDYGTASITRTVDVVIVDKDTLTATDVATALAKEDGVVAVVQGVVTGFNYYGSPYIQDADGTAIVVDYFSGTVAVGDQITVLGKLETDTHYDERRYLDFIELYTIDSSDNTVFVITDQLPAIVKEDDILTLANKMYTMTVDFESVDSYGYAHFTGDGTTTLTFKVSSTAPWLEVLFTAGTDAVTMTFIMSDLNFGNVRIDNVDIPLTDAQKMTIAEDELTGSIPASVTSDLTLETDVYGVTVVWTSTNTAINPTTGVVTRPANGDGDETGNVVATLTLGTETPVVLTFATTVPEMAPPQPDLFFSEYAEADGGTCKYIEIYNPTDATVDLTGYSIAKGSNGGSFGTPETLSGTLASGGTLVVRASTCTSDGDAAQTAGNPAFPKTGLQEIVSSMMNFNGDDALGLFKGAVLIDAIGVEGTDPGSSWTVGNGNLTDGSTANTILVRVSTVTMGETNWAVGAQQWIVSSDDRDYSTVGDHTCSLPVT